MTSVFYILLKRICYAKLINSFICYTKSSVVSILRCTRWPIWNMFWYDWSKYQALLVFLFIWEGTLGRIQAPFGVPGIKPDHQCARQALTHCIISLVSYFPFFKCYPAISTLFIRMQKVKFFFFLKSCHSYVRKMKFLCPFEIIEGLSLNLYNKLMGGTR